MKRPANQEEVALAEMSEVEHMMQLVETDNVFGY
jgi:hypothetical protein